MTGYFHIVLAMKPVEGGFAENALAFGVSGLNIDECRVGMGEGGNKPEYQPNMSNAVYGSGMGGGDWKNVNGRFPANVILGHAEGCRCVGNKKVDAQGHWTNMAEVGAKGIYGKFAAMDRDRGNILADADGKEETEDWECVESCPMRALGEQSGESESTNNPRRNQPSDSIGTFKTHYRETQGHSDSGTAARFFKQISEYHE